MQAIGTKELIQRTYVRAWADLRRITDLSSAQRAYIKLARAENMRHNLRMRCVE